MKRFPSKFNALATLRNLGVEIGTVLDVGVHEQTPELIAAFGDKRHILFEPVSNFHPMIARNYDGVSCEIVEAGVSNFDGTARLERHIQESGEITHSQIITSVSRDDLPELPIVRLDTFMMARTETKPYLVKIDVDGVEQEIIEGCRDILQDVAVIIVETTQRNFIDRINILTGLGFHLFDIVDTVYYYGVFHQADLVMVSPQVMELEGMRPWETRPFDWSQSVHVAMYEPSEVRTLTTMRTGNLRYAVPSHATTDAHRLQEEWRTVETGQHEWRDIETVVVSDLPPRARPDDIAPVPGSPD